MDSIIDLNSLDEIFVYLSAFFGAFLVALWISSVFWTYRDIRSRSRDRIIQIVSTIIVALLTLPGLAIYLILRPKVTLDDAYQKSLEEEALLTEIESRKVCPGCGKELKVCLNCRFYSPGSHWDCRETIDEPVTNKEKVNFCAYFVFKPSKTEQPDNKKQQDSAKNAFLNLFQDNE